MWDLIVFFFYFLLCKGCHGGNTDARIAMCCQDGRGRFPVYRTSSPNLDKLAKEKKSV